MESTFAALYRALGMPQSELHDMAYRRFRWACGCTAAGLSTGRLLHTRCLRHRRVPVQDSMWLRR
jgi:hypothetical protein